MELKRRRNKRRGTLKGCQGALCLKQPPGMKCGVLQTLFCSPSSACTKTVPWMLHGLSTREKRNENNTAAFPFYRSCLMTSVIRDCRAEVGYFSLQDPFNSAQIHLLVEEKRKNNRALVLLLWSAGTASLKNARNESSSGKELPVGARAQPCLGWEDFWVLAKLRCPCALCHLSVSYLGNWTVKRIFWSLFLGMTTWSGQERGSRTTRLVGDSLGAPRLGTATSRKAKILPKGMRTEFVLLFLLLSHTHTVGFGLGGPISVW